MIKQRLKKLYMLVLLLVAGSAIPTFADIKNAGTYFYVNNYKLTCERNYVEFGFADYDFDGNDDAFKDITIYVRLQNGSEVKLATFPRCHDDMQRYNPDYGAIMVWGHNDNGGKASPRIVYCRYYPGAKAMDAKMTALRLTGKWDIDDNNSNKGGDDYWVDESRDFNDAGKFDVAAPSNLTFTRPTATTVAFSGQCTTTVTNGFTKYMEHSPGGTFSMGTSNSVSGTLSGNFNPEKGDWIYSKCYVSKTESVKNGSYGNKGGEYIDVYQRFYGSRIDTQLSSYPVFNDLNASRDPATQKVTLNWRVYSSGNIQNPYTIYRRKANAPASAREKLEELPPSIKTFTEANLPNDPFSDYLYEVVCHEPNWNEAAGSEYLRHSVTVGKIATWEGAGTAESPYLIKNEADLRLLSIYVNSEYITADKYWKQTADIDLGGEARPWTPIGESLSFKGNYNGGGFTVSNMYIAGNHYYCGFFGAVFSTDISNNRVIENVRLKAVNVNVDNTMSVGALAGDIYGVIVRNCYVEGTVSGKNKVGGFMGLSTANAVENCGFVGTVSGVANVGGFANTSGTKGSLANCYASATVTATGSENIGAFSGTNYGTFTNCYYDSTLAGTMKGVGVSGSAESTDISGGITPKTTEQFKSGEVTWLLNGSKAENPVWYQTIGTDNLPLLDKTHKVVGEWGEGYYSNEPNPWTEGNGTKDAPYIISNEAQLRALATYTNDGGKTAGKFWKQTADIDLGGEARPWTSIGNENKSFKGRYNGDGFTVSNMYCSNGFFGFLYGVQSVIENICLSNATVTGDGVYVGVLVGNASNATIRNCYAEGTVIGNMYVGGLAGEFSQSTAENCGFTGSVKGNQYTAGFFGSGIMSHVYNSYSAAAVNATGPEYTGAVCGYNHHGTYTNCYYDSTLAGSMKGVGAQGSTESSDVEGLAPKTTEQFKSGEVTWLLNGSKAETPTWYQTLGTDTYPLLDKTHKVVSDWDEGYYSNDPKPWTEGNGTKDAPYIISNEAQLRALATYTNNGGKTAGRFWKQTADIDLGGEARPWIPIGLSPYGSDKFSFNGSYNGGGFTVKNMYLATSSANSGFFGNITGILLPEQEQPKIENIRLYNAFVSSTDYITGTLAGAAGASTVRNCYAEGTVSGSYAVGGLIGMFGGVSLENCGFAGTVSGTDSVGGLVGNFNRTSNVSNCYAAAVVNATGPDCVGAFSGFKMGEYTNCYYDSTLAGSMKGVGKYNSLESLDIKGITPKTTEQFKSGEVTWLLNGSQSETPVWYQTLGEDAYPLLDNTHKLVDFWGNSYHNERFPWTEGEGTAEAPYLISNEAQLRALATYTNSGNETAGKFWKQTADIDLGGEARPWTPIGNFIYSVKDIRFNGNYNGSGFTVSNIHVATTDEMVCGFFGYLSGEQLPEQPLIENIRLKGVNITGHYISSVAANVSCVTMRNCYAEGVDIRGTLHGDEASNGGFTGGFVGNVFNSTFENCGVTGTVSGERFAGGFVGSPGDQRDQFTNCYAATTVTATGSEYIGAFTGIELGTYTNCYYDSTLAGSMKGVGVAGSTESKDIDGITPKTTEQFKSGEVTWLLNGSKAETPTWYQTLGTDTYPLLDATHKTVYFWGGHYFNEACPWAEGEGTAEAPILIQNEADLRNLAEWTNGGNLTENMFWKQTADIDLGGEARPWIPIGVDFDIPFEGNYNGGGYTIRNLCCKANLLDPNMIEPRIGLFGRIAGKEGAVKLVVENIRVVNAVIAVTGESLAGIIAEGASHTIIRNCMTQGKLSAPDVMNGALGGIAGESYKLSVENCAAHVTIDGGYYQGGILGSDYLADIRNCYAAATFLNPTECTGALSGIIGIYSSGFGVKENCYYDSSLSNGRKAVGLQSETAGSQISNFDIEGCTPKTTEQFKSGEVTWLLNGSQSAAPTWYQTIYMDDYPLLDATHGVVLSDGNKYYNNGGIWQGEGTKEAPYLISNETELRVLASYTNDGNTTAGKFWKQTADIDLGGEARPWTPIGNLDIPFKGNYNGGGFTVSNMHVYSAGSFSGFFGYISGKSYAEQVLIENIRFKNANSGGLNHYRGVLAGNIQYATVRNCYAEGSVSGNNNVGGLAGDNYVVTFENCGFVGTVSGNNRVGGLVGNGNMGIYTNCYAAATVASTGTECVGAFCGENQNPKPITNCYYDSTLAGAMKGVGARGTTENSDVEGLTPKTTEEFASGEITWLLNGSKAETPTWYQTLGEDAYPLLDATRKVVDFWGGSYHNGPFPWQGEGTREAPYLISNEAQLRALAAWTNGGGVTAGKFWKQTTDINLGGQERPWTPIGAIENPFQGNYNGGGFLVRELYVNNSGFGGLFGCVYGNELPENPVIENIRMKIVTVTASYNYAATLVGDLIKTIVRNCSAEGSVSGNNYVGGLVGEVFGGIFENCGFIGYVKGNDSTGGFAGTASSLNEFTNCYSAANVTGTGKVGAFAGFPGAIICTNCYYDSTFAGTLKGTGIIESDGSQDVEGLTPKTTDQFASGEVTYLLNGSQSENPVWYQALGFDAYPSLIASVHEIVYKWPDGTYSNDEYVVPNWQGVGTAESPYLIQNLEDLKYLAKFADSMPTEGIYWKQTADIDMSSNTDKWNNIGTMYHPFSGNYNGGGFRISNITDNESDGNLFGAMKGAYDAPVIIENMYIDNAVTSRDVLSFEANYIIVRNCYVSAVINNPKDWIGGYFGTLTDGTMENCVFTGSVEARKLVGGLVGNCTDNTTFINCYVSASVVSTAQEDYGMFAGMNDGNLSVQNCWYDSTKANGAKAFGNASYEDGDLGVQSKPALEGTALAAELGIANWNFTGGVLPVQKLFEPGNVYDITFDDSFDHRDITADIANATVRLKKSATETWTTVQLPFALTESQLAGWGTFYEFTGYDAVSNKAKFKEVTSTVAHGCYLWKRTANSEYWDAEGVTVNKNDEYGYRPDAEVMFVGTDYAKLAMGNGPGFYQLKDVGSGENEDCYFGEAVIGDIFKPFSGMLALAIPGAKDRIEIEVTDRNGITTGIMQVEIDYSNGTYEVYDLYGRRLPKPVQGFNIINGQKVYIK